MPNNVTFLVDTYDTLEGVKRAIEVASRLESGGHRFMGVRIDSGDLAWLSVRVRALLDEAGFADARVVASNELDEHLISSLKEQGAAIDVWGVGTKLVTGWDQPALGGVYKLAAIRRPGGAWVPRVKLTEQTAKATAPGIQGVRRFRRSDGTLAGDMVYDLMHPPTDPPTMVDPADATRRKTFDAEQNCAELLVPVYRGGERVYESPELSRIRAHALASVGELDASIKRFLNPHLYPVGLERGLHDVRAALVMRARGIRPEDAAPSAEAIAQADTLVADTDQEGE
jgi:nicotinate phosphoribosyltransferase